MKKVVCLLLALVMLLGLVACASNTAPATEKTESTTTEETKTEETKTEETKTEEAAPAEETASTEETGNVHIGIVTGSVSQSEDDRRGAEAFQAMYGEEMVKLAIYPDNFTEELETTIQTIVNLSDDPDMKAIIVNQGVPGHRPRPSVRSRSAAPTSSASPVSPTKTCPRSAPLLTSSATTTSLPAAT